MSRNRRRRTSSGVNDVSSTFGLLTLEHPCRCRRVRAVVKLAHEAAGAFVVEEEGLADQIRDLEAGGMAYPRAPHDGEDAISGFAELDELELKLADRCLPLVPESLDCVVPAKHS